MDDEHDDDFETEDDDTSVNDAGSEVAAALDTAAIDFDNELKMLFANDPKGYRALRTIGAFIMRGMSLRESCVLSRISYESFEALMHKHQPIASFIEFKQTAYKASLVNVLAGSATTAKQAKVAGYLLEKQYSDEYGKKTKDERQRPPDSLERALEAVRESGDSEPLIRRLPAPTVNFAPSSPISP